MRREGRCTADCEAEPNSLYVNPDWNPNKKYDPDELYCRCGPGSTPVNKDDGDCFDC